jgi:hypothetical protein
MIDDRNHEWSIGSDVRGSRSQNSCRHPNDLDFAHHGVHVGCNGYIHGGHSVDVANASWPWSSERSCWFPSSHNDHTCVSHWPLNRGACGPCSFEVEHLSQAHCMHGPLLGSTCIVLTAMRLMSILLSHAVCPALTNTPAYNIRVECLTTLQMNASLLAHAADVSSATDLHAHNSPQAGCLHTCSARRD